MPTEPLRSAARIPRWVWAIAAGYACLPPLLHAWLWYAPHANGVPTGLQGADSVVFLHCMRMFATGFFSPFASCHAPHGDHFAGYYATPFFWLYGVAGALGRVCRINEFMTLGIANGAAVMLYLIAAFVFLRQTVPHYANRAFVLLALGGSPGGLLYLGCAVFGYTDAPSFEPVFQRYSMSLLEGSSMVMAPRLYYTIPLALSLFGLAQLARGDLDIRLRRHAIAAALLGLGAFFNLRVGPMAWTAAMLYLSFGAHGSFQRRLRAAAFATFGIGVGLAAGWAAMSVSPTYAQNALQSVRNSLPFSSYIADNILFLAILPIALVPAFRALPRLGRLAMGAAIGYLAAFTLLYAAYQTYYGNWIAAREYAVTIAISDWALLGAVAGSLCALWITPRHDCRDAPDPTAWFALWLLGFLAIAISAFGHGWFMRLVPARLLAFMGPPLCVVTAAALHRLDARGGRRVGAAVMCAIVVCGVSSLAVAYACFMGPCGWRADMPAFAWTHCELMNPADAKALEAIGPGRTLTPYIPGPQFSDVISLRPGAHVVLGMGTLNMSDLDPQRMEGVVARFFASNVSGEERRRIAREWCIDYIFCSETRPVDPAVIAELKALPWLSVTAAEGKAVLFRVNAS